MRIYSYDDYRTYVKDRVNTVFKTKRGHLTYLAKAAGCQPSYMTKILAGSADLSLEQAVLLNEPLQHTPEESQFFMLLVQYSRAGSEDLRSYFKSLMSHEKTKNENLTAELNIKEVRNATDQSSKLYEHWWHVAILTVINLKGMNEPISIAKRLNLPIAIVQESLQLLERIGYIKKQKAGWSAEIKKTHVKHGNSAVISHHINWRLKEIEKLNQAQVNEMECYTSVICLSKKDLQRVRQILVQATKESKELISSSPEEVLACFSWSLFEF